MVFDFSWRKVKITAMKKHFALALLTLTSLLTSCASSDPAGTYSFRMGKDKGAHFAVFLELTNKSYETDPSKGNLFTLSLEIELEPNASSSEQTTSIEEEGSIDPIYDLLPIDLNHLQVGGYYRVGNTQEDANRLYMGVSSIAGLDFGDDLSLPPDLVEYFMISSIYPNHVDIVLPVSTQDLSLQLYWFGFLWDTEYVEEDLNLVPHEIGSHPTSDDIIAINKDGAFEKHYGYPFRDYNTITMGLNKA